MCVCRQDDILIGGVSWQENIKILSEVLERLHEYIVHLKMAKCEFLNREVVYLGRKIDVEGLHPVDDKVDTVKRAPVPQNVKELRSFLVMVQYYHPFLPDLAATLSPLHELLKKGRYKSRTGSTRTASPSRIDPDQLGSTRIVSEHEKKHKMK